MRLVFCGTPEFAVPTLVALIEAGHEIALVVTQPDRAAGRGLVMQAPPVKRVALERGIAVLQPETIRKNVDFRERMEVVAPDAVIVVAYGRIIPPWMLELPRLGNINLHGSLLPKYRGAAPVQWAVANGETVTGVTTMRLDMGLDTGPMLKARVVPIGAEEGAAEVLDRLAAVGAELMVETMRGLKEGTLDGVEQDHTQATLAPILTREDGRVDFAWTAGVIHNRWRGFYPWPGAHTTFRRQKLILHAVTPVGMEALVTSLESTGGGELLVSGGGLHAVCGGMTALRLDELQVEGKRRMSAAEFVRGYQVKSGERLG